MEKQMLFTETVKGESRTYFFDLKEASNGKPYLSITETSKNKEGEFERRRTFVFENDLEKFSSAVANAMKAYTELDSAKAA
ncbi:MAG: DUF3276 family protein [Mameliella sp.]|nr:DUF3276 family protein [Phaeodactylibacter sp.]NRA48805.1 DUF3276 family protein [Phaeodactylibacter sp.]